MKTTSVRHDELRAMTHAELLTLVLTNSPKASPKRRASLAGYTVNALANEVLNYEWGAGLVDLNEDDCAGCSEPAEYCICGEPNLCAVCYEPPFQCVCSYVMEN